MNRLPANAKEAVIPSLTALNYMKEMNKHRLDGVAVNFYDTRITCRQLFEGIDRAAAAFAAMGVKRDEIVSFVSVCTPEMIYCLYALNKLGAAANTIDPRMDSATISKYIRESHSRYLVVLDAVFGKVLPVKEEIAQEKIIVLPLTASMPFMTRMVANSKVPKLSFTPDMLRWKDFLKQGEGTIAEEAPYVGDATVVITYTGGTTGMPKGVMLTNDSLNAVAVNVRYTGLDHADGERYLDIIPVFTSYGFACGMHMPLCMCQELIPIPQFVPAEFGALVKKWRPQHFISTPAFIDILMNSEEVRGLDMSFIRYVVSGGDTMNEGLENKLKKFMEEHHIVRPLAQGYGMSELSSVVSFNVNDAYKPGSVGVILPTMTVGIFHPDTGEELDYYEVGEVCITGPSMMKGYFEKPEETANIMHYHEDDGRVWIHSGDLGYVDNDGFLFIKGRIKRMICRFDGHKVYPHILEGLIAARSDIADVSVIEVTDMDHGQGKYPLVVAKFRGVYDLKAACRELYTYCYEYAEERGRPVAVIAVDAIPLTGMGKADYRKMEEQYGEFDYKSWLKENGLVF